mgnify:FL=1
MNALRPNELAGQNVGAITSMGSSLERTKPPRHKCGCGGNLLEKVMIKTESGREKWMACDKCGRRDYILEKVIA